MADDPIDLKLIDGEYRVVKEQKAPVPAPAEEYEWIPPTTEEYEGLIRVLMGVLVPALIGGLTAWWKLHHH